MDHFRIVVFKVYRFVVLSPYRHPWTKIRRSRYTSRWWRILVRVIFKTRFLQLNSDSSIQVCADGCGWGDGARTAARIAVLSMLKTLAQNVLQDAYSSTGKPSQITSSLLIRQFSCLYGYLIGDHFRRLK